MCDCLVTFWSARLSHLICRKMKVASHFQGDSADPVLDQRRSNDVMMRRACARCGASSMTPSICTTPVALASNAASTRSAQRRSASVGVKRWLMMATCAGCIAALAENPSRRAASSLAAPARNTNHAQDRYCDIRGRSIAARDRSKRAFPPLAAH